MLIQISTSGGFGGLPGSEIQLSTTLNDLPPAQSSAFCDAFKPSTLKALSEQRPPSGRADTISYEITVTDNEGAHRFQLDETQLPPEMIDMIDELVAK